MIKNFRLDKRDISDEDFKHKINEIIDVVNTITEKDRMLRPGGSAYDLNELAKIMKKKERIK
jgi:hypothetical protein